jgi:CheY-like chemotaxis protein
VLQGDILPGMDGWTDRLRTVTGLFGFMNPALGEVNKGFEEYDKAVAEAAEESTRLSENQAALAANHAVLTDAVGNTGKAIRTFAGRSGEELEEFRDSMQDTFRVGSTTFEELADKARVSANQILASLRKQVKAQEDYQENLEELKQRNIPDALLEQLTALGLDGAQVIEALAESNQRRFREIVSEWRTSETNARSIANAIAGIGSAVNNLPTNKTVNVHFNVTSTVGAALSNVAAQVDDAIRAALARTGGA